MARTRTRFRGHQRRWLLRMIVVLAVSGVGWLLSWAYQGQGGQQKSHATVGIRAPVFTLPSGSGDPVALASYLGRQSVVLVFYMGDF